MWINNFFQVNAFKNIIHDMSGNLLRMQSKFNVLKKTIMAEKQLLLQNWIVMKAWRAIVTIAASFKLFVVLSIYF